ncbi:MAG: hypothetical protein Q9181_002791 [Wetmoreana brouardii]
MLAHADSQSTAHVHKPARNTSLRQVISTDEHQKAEAAHTARLRPSSDSAADGSDDTIRRPKVVTLGIHDSSSTSSCALLDVNVFPQGIVGRGSPISITPAHDNDPVVDGQPYHDKSSFNHIKGSAMSNTTYLFVAKPMASDMATKSPGVQISISSNEANRLGLKPHSQVIVSTVNQEDHQASHVEIAFRDEYLSRGDMWRLVVSELAGKVIHKGQRLAFLGTIKILIKAIYIHGKRVLDALFSASTKPIFRSESARYVLFIQMSKEMWHFDTDGTGEIMFDKVINGFLPDLFKRWQQINARHLVTIVMFTRLDLSRSLRLTPVVVGPHSGDQTALRGSSHQDFYRVVVSDMPNGEWSDILVQLKREFRVFLRDVSVCEPSAKANVASNEGLAAAFSENPASIITGSPCSALQGNILEAVNLASSQFSCDYIDRDLVRTGISVIVITPGTGLFEVDYKLLATTTDNLIENGVGIDLVCLSRIPLHSVPLFKYRPPKNSRPPELGLRKGSVREVSLSWLNDSLSVHNRQIDTVKDASYSSMGTSFGSIRGRPDAEWDYGIPHWVDVSYWTSSTGSSHSSSVLSDGRHTGLVMGDQSRRKPFMPRARMYEIQMMGVMENSVNQIRLPHLPKAPPIGDHKSAMSSSIVQSKPADSRMPHLARSMSREHGDLMVQTPSSSVTSKSNDLATRPKTQYGWMNEYDELLFRHPRRRQAARLALSHASILASRTNKKKHHDRAGLDSGTPPSDNALPSSVRDLGSSRHFDRAMKERVPLRTKSTAHPSSTVDPPTGPNALQSKPPILSRKLSLGFRGFGTGTGKATASTEVSVEHARSTSIATGRRKASAKPGSASQGPSNPITLNEDQGDGVTITHSNDSNEPPLISIQKNHGSARPIPIRNPTEIRIVAGKEGLPSQSSGLSPTLVLERDEHLEAASSPQQPDMLHSQVESLSEDFRLTQMSPKRAMAPWLTVINPSNPNKMDSDSTSRLGRWQHIFPKKLRASKIKWKSLCSPAAVPLTTEEFPSPDELVLDYASSKHKVELSVDDELLERPRSRDWLIREMMSFRFSQGFQVVVGPRLAHALYLSRFESFDVFNDNQLAQADTTIVMSRGSMIHKISITGAGHVEVECLTRRAVAAQCSITHATETDVYQPMIRTMLAEDYTRQDIPIALRRGQLDWSVVDSHIAGHQKHETDQQDDNLRSWRARFVLIPVVLVSSTRRPMFPPNEDNEEEIRLEGIKKLTQIWQRFRYVSPSERRFQAPLRKRKDENPLDIMYQTRNPSAVVWAEKDNLGEDVSTGKPVQLLPESDLFQRSTLNLQTLAQTLQGDKGVRVRDRRWHFRLHYNSIIGFELTSWLLQNFRDVDTREEAVELGNELMQSGLIEHVAERHNFRDGNYFYHITSEYLSARPESRSIWFGSRRADKSVPSTPISEAPTHDSPKAPASRASSTDEHPENDTSAPIKSRQRLGVELGKSLLYDVDHRKRSYRPELITLHYDRIHNPDNCYHIRIDWMNVTSKLIEDTIVSWATAVDRFGLRLVELPLAEASTITSMHPFRAPALVKLAKGPPSEQPQTYFDATSFTPHARTEKHFYQIAIMKKFDFVLDFEAASAFPLDVDVTYSWGKPDYNYPQYIHRSGTLLAQITDDGDFLLLANRLYNNRSSGNQENARSEEATDSSKYGSGRTGTHRGSPHISPYLSPLVRATGDTMPLPPSRAPKPTSVFALPGEIKKQFEAFCGDAAALENFYNEVLSKTSTPSTSTPRVSTPSVESSIPTLGLPPSLVARERSPAPRAKTWIVGGGGGSGGSPKTSASAPGDGA